MRPYVSDERHALGALVLVGVSIAGMLKTKLGPMWFVGVGAIAGALGWV